MNDEIFALTPQERADPLWLKLKAQMEKKRSDSLGKLAGDLGEIPTAKLRGRIAMLKELLRLGEESPITDD